MGGAVSTGPELMRNPKSQTWALLLAVLVLTLDAQAQTNVPTIKAEVKSAFVWGEDSSSGAVSSTIQDPLTGNAMRRLSYAGIEVSTQLGFEGVGANQEGTLLNYTTTVVNGTDSPLSVRYGGISVDGHRAAPLLLVRPGKKLNKKERKTDVAELQHMHCFTSGFLSPDNFLLTDAPSRVLTIAAGTALTISSVIRDPRTYQPLLCSTQGCYPTGTIRYYVTVNSQDYVFVWPGRSAVYCGK